MNLSKINNKKLYLITGGVMLVLIIIVAIITSNKPKSTLSNQKKKDAEIIHYKELLAGAMSGEKKVFTEDNKSITFNQIKLTDGNYANAKQYVFLNLDNDAYDEAIISTETDYVILRFEKEKVYSYVIKKDNFVDLKEDGSFRQNKSDNEVNYVTISFNKNKYDFTTTASSNGEEYKVNNKKVSKEEFDNYVSSWEGKETANWINY